MTTDLANRSFAPFEIGLLAEGGSAKKWGDFGGFLAVDSYRNRVELWYAAVDLFYNTKEDELPEDRYLTEARSAGLR